MPTSRPVGHPSRRTKCDRNAPFGAFLAHFRVGRSAVQPQGLDRLVADLGRLVGRRTVRRALGEEPLNGLDIALTPGPFVAGDPPHHLVAVHRRQSRRPRCAPARLDGPSRTGWCLRWVDGPRRLRPRSVAVRPIAGPSAAPPERCPRRRGRDLGQAGGLQLGHRVRRQQGAQAGVPRRRRAGPGLRHAGVDRRRPVQPHPPGHRRGLPPRPQGGHGAGALGGLAGPELRRRRQRAADPHHGRRRPARRRRLRHRRPRQLEGRPGVRRPRPAAGRTRSPPAPPTIRSADSGSPTGRERWPPRRPSSACSSTTSSCAR